MNHNYSVWGTVESIVAAYKIMDENGNIVPDVESQVIVRRMLTALIRFFADNELLKVKPFDADGKLIDRQYFRSEFADEGIALIKRKESAWLDSKASKKNPPDMKILEKALAEIRTGK
ncbi:hypothetical protein [Pseudomonas lundensis]|uniref:hypothetical protein n=1 Tax=Pseudomonas lundensis TaxID=86185 RepID=UPI001891A468|nr:hypothetical protein [Pseudomonas lundensis]QOF91790.1 hypothetical protein IF654_00915 [Pseudomonas lundensis]